MQAFGFDTHPALKPDLIYFFSHHRFLSYDGCSFVVAPVVTWININSALIGSLNADKLSVLSLLQVQTPRIKRCVRIWHHSHDYM